MPTFTNLLHRICRKAIAKTPVFGLAYGFSQGVLFLGYVVTFGFGAYQVTRQEG